MSLSGDIIDLIAEAFPPTVHCGACDREVDISDLLTMREWNKLAADILKAVADEIQE